MSDPFQAMEDGITPKRPHISATGGVAATINDGMSVRHMSTLVTPPQPFARATLSPVPNAENVDATNGTINPALARAQEACKYVHAWKIVYL